MVTRALVAAAITMVSPHTVSAQVPTEQAAGCFNTADGDAAVQVEGRLVRGTFTDEYGKERAYLLHLRKPTCIDDGGEFADPAVQFVQVQVAGTNEAAEKALRKSVGREIKVSGRAFAAHTRHHHRPMVVLADQVRPVRR